eukprot:Colp12_sorted_trinity150504_noHs@17646
MRELGRLPTAHGPELVFVEGNLLEFEGDAIVNAANEGGVTGFGIDEAINRAAGDADIKEARRAFGGIPTGTARITGSFAHKRVQWIIHAVGPVYRASSLKHAKLSEAEKDALLVSAYQSALKVAGEHGVRTLGLCPLSAGVFRGERALDDIIGIGVRAVCESAHTQGMERLVMVAYTKDEAECMQRLCQR